MYTRPRIINKRQSWCINIHIRLIWYQWLYSWEILLTYVGSHIIKTSASTDGIWIPIIKFKLINLTLCSSHLWIEVYQLHQSETTLIILFFLRDISLMHLLDVVKTHSGFLELMHRRSYHSFYKPKGRLDSFSFLIQSCYHNPKVPFNITFKCPKALCTSLTWLFYLLTLPIQLICFESRFFQTHRVPCLEATSQVPSFFLYLRSNVLFSHKYIL